MPAPAKPHPARSLERIAYFIGAILLLGPIARANEVLLPGITGAQLDGVLKGQLLLEELNCVACHEASPTLAATSKKAPRLSGIGAPPTEYRIRPADTSSPPSRQADDKQTNEK